MRGRGSHGPEKNHETNRRAKRVSIPLRGRGSHGLLEEQPYLLSEEAVSIPLRGRGSHGHRKGEKDILGLYVVSIPLRGRGSHGLNHCPIKAEDEDSEFPSPCGGEVVMDLKERYLYWKWYVVSIPLRGRGSHGQTTPKQLEIMKPI